MMTPDEISPFVLIQECCVVSPHGEWKLLVCCIMLNQTSARQVWPLVPGFFTRFPDPFSLATADRREVASWVRTLGLHNRRSSILVRMSRAFLEWDRTDPTELPGVGRYASDSWRIFVDPRKTIADVTDKELRNYISWAMSRGSNDKKIT